MKRVTRSSFFALYGAFCGLGIGIVLAMLLTVIESALFGPVDGLFFWRRMSMFCSMSGFVLGLYYSLQKTPN